MQQQVPTILLLCLIRAVAVAQPTDIPNAQPGKCYAKCLVHDKYETVTEQIMIRPESTEQIAIPPVLETVNGQYVAKESYTRLVLEAAVFDIVEEKIQVSPPGRKTNPAAYEAVQEDVLIKPATRTFAVTDAVFQTVQEPVEIEPAYMLLEVLPQRYESVLERIEVRPAGTRWIRKNSDRDCLGADPDDCFVWCLVEVPAQYQTIYKQESIGCEGEDPTDCVRYTPVAAKTTLKPVQRVKTPAGSTEQMEPAEYQTLTRWVLKPGVAEPAGGGPGEFVTVRKKVLKKPATIREEGVPAEYKPIVQKVLKTQPALKTESLPPEYVTIIKRQLVRKGGFPEWREILCGEKMTGYTIRQIQEALKALGYYQGVADGTLNAHTKTALARFQQERDLPADGNVDFETLQALGIGM
ncbi:MAG: peptidoglycan-binding protein [Lewinellaceae bacterium]|nr:peptidoglycan-binding protein [Lewinellaceae bacterium]